MRAFSTSMSSVPCTRSPGLSFLSPISGLSHKLFMGICHKPPTGCKEQKTILLLISADNPDLMRLCICESRVGQFLIGGQGLSAAGLFFAKKARRKTGGRE